jgi:long-chain acyl-CoA synthetase
MDDQTLPTSNVGRPLVGVQIGIWNERKKVLPANTIGEIWVKGPMVMLGYYNDPEKTAEVMHDGWLDTGDLGYLDTEGRLVITGRKKDLIINKGLNIYPQEIENVLLMHPTAIRAAVIGVPDDISGEMPVAYVQIKSHETGVEAKLRALCIRNLAAYKIPKQIIVVTHNLPLTATGKVDKKVLRKEYASK